MKLIGHRLVVQQFEKRSFYSRMRPLFSNWREQAFDAQSIGNLLVRLSNLDASDEGAENAVIVVSRMSDSRMVFFQDKRSPFQ